MFILEPSAAVSARFREMNALSLSYSSFSCFNRSNCWETFVNAGHLAIATYNRMNKQKGAKVDVAAMSSMGMKEYMLYGTLLLCAAA